MAKTSLSGRANCAPMAAGRPKPMDPRPPELNHSRGSLKRINCAAHIWCWPTSEETMASPLERRSISAIRCCGLISVSEVTGCSGCSSFQPRIWCHQARRAALRASPSAAGLSAISLFSLPSTRFTSPTMGTSGVRILADFGGIDIHVDHLGVRREGRQAAGDAIVEADAERDQQVASVIAMLAA